MDVHFIDADRLNPFGASEQEFMAYALDDAGLLRPETVIDGKLAREFLESFYKKRETYRESTRLGMLLVSQGVLNREQLAAALSHQQRLDGAKIGEVVLRLGFCRIEDLERALETQTRIRVDIDELETYRSQVAAARARLNARF